MDDLISRLSEIRSNYNCFDEAEEPHYRALSEAIKALNTQNPLQRVGSVGNSGECVESVENADECKVCANADNDYCFACENGDKFKPITNANRIRSMADEELATWLNCMQSNAWHRGRMMVRITAYPDTNQDWCKWLKQEAEEEA